MSSGLRFLDSRHAPGATKGARRAILAGVRTIEHGTGASEDTLKLRREKGVVLVQCLAANEAMLHLNGSFGFERRREYVIAYPQLGIEKR